MAVQFTFFQMLMALLTLAMASCVGILIKKKKYKTAAILLAAWLLLLAFAPIRTTTNTQHYNAQQVERFAVGTQKDLRELAPRVVVERENYDEFLNRKSEQFKTNTNTIAE